MRLQRGLQVLGQGSQFLPQFGTGFGTGQQAIGGYQQPGTLGRVAGAVGNVASIFNTVGGLFGGNKDQAQTGP